MSDGHLSFGFPLFGLIVLIKLSDKYSHNLEGLVTGIQKISENGSISG